MQALASPSSAVSAASLTASPRDPLRGYPGSGAGLTRAGRGSAAAMQESAQDGVAEPTPAGGTSAPALGPPRPPSRSRVAPAAGLEAERGSGGDGSSPGEPDGRTPPGPSDVVIGPPLGAMWDRKGSTVARQTMLSPTSRVRVRGRCPLPCPLCPLAFAPAGLLGQSGPHHAVVLAPCLPR